MEVRGEFLIKHVIVCGDDFGMNADIDEAMISLAALGRMSAVSCLTLGPTFLANAARLAKLDIDLGLHLNLTEALSDGAQAMPSLSRLIMRAYAGRLDAAWVDAQLERQFDAFEAAFGRMPDYVDGHQHVHQLPVVRQRLLALLALRRAHALASADRAGHAQRHSTQGNVQGPCDRRAGRGALGRDAARDGLRTNRRMLGVYGFEGGKRHYADLLQNWLVNACDGDLLMCHPPRTAAAIAPCRASAARSTKCWPARRWANGCAPTACASRAWTLPGTDPARHASIRLCNSQAPAEPSARRMDQTASTRVCRGQPGTGSSTS